jgi:4-alpha-glucanotransferase
MIRQDLVRLAHAHGIGDSYTNWCGEPQSLTDAALLGLLAVMGVDASTADAPTMAPAVPGSIAPPAVDALRCHVPPALAGGAKWWGVTAQLYSLRSAGDWGLGDFGTLRELVRHAAGAGAAFIGLNPLHALFPADPAHVSPYSPSSRHYLSVAMIEVPRVVGYATHQAVQEIVGSARFVAEIARLRALRYADAAGVMALKLPVLRLLHASFRREHLLQGSPLGEAFRRYVADEGEALQLQATFDALQAHMRALDEAHWGWDSWPVAYRDARSAAVREFARENAVEVEFYAWLQWVAQAHLAEAQALARDLGMAVGVYGDYAVGVNPGGAETWADAATYCLGAGIGAPPDSLALLGQDWGIPPQSPAALAASGGEAFRALIRNNLRYFGALRIDHVMALFRQWWVPRGYRATEGGYVHYPLELMLDVLAEESRARQCLIVGEDLGTVPEAIRVTLPARAVHSYKVALFERGDGGAFRAPRDYQTAALAVLSTHDLPTLRGWWEAEDIDLRDRLRLYPSDAVRDALKWDRGVDKWRFLEALRAEGIAPEAPVDGAGPYTAALNAALHRFLGRTRSALAAVQVEDLAMEVDPVNVPGTDREHPNWCRRLEQDTGELFSTGDAMAVLEAMAAGRREAASRG